MKKTQESTLEQDRTVIAPEVLLENWQGHRRLTRRVIEAFPDDKLFTYAVGGMRPFAELAQEMIGMAVPGMTGIVTGKWELWSEKAPATTKTELLSRWDHATDHINKNWPLIPPGRFQERDLAFGQWEGPIHWILFYFIDNEIHHRGQGYVYLRSLGIAPPPFWDRG